MTCKFSLALVFLNLRLFLFHIIHFHLGKIASFCPDPSDKYPQASAGSKSKYKSGSPTNILRSKSKYKIGPPQISCDLKANVRLAATHYLEINIVDCLVAKWVGYLKSSRCQPNICFDFLTFKMSLTIIRLDETHDIDNFTEG